MFKLILVAIISITLSGCLSSTPKDLEPIIRGKHDVSKIYYPSTDSKVSAIVVTKDGEVYYYRLNGFGEPRDEVFLFNKNDK